MTGLMTKYYYHALVNASKKIIKIFSAHFIFNRPELKYSRRSLSGHSCGKQTALLTAALTKPRLNSSSYKLCIYTFP